MQLNANRRDPPFSDDVSSPLTPIDADEACLRAFQDELDYIHRTLLRLGALRADVEDLMQDLFIALRGSWHRCDKSRPLRPYLFGIAFRIVAAHRRKRNREVPLGLVDVPDTQVDVDAGLRSKQARRPTKRDRTFCPQQFKALRQFDDPSARFHHFFTTRKSYSANSSCAPFFPEFDAVCTRFFRKV